MWLILYAFIGLRIIIIREFFIQMAVYHTRWFSVGHCKKNKNY